MKTRAAVAWEAKKPLTIVTIDLEGPKAGEVLVEVMATGICHTDAYTLSGLDSEGKFPAILGHEGAASCASRRRRHDPEAGRPRHPPLYTPDAATVSPALSQRTNLCTAIRSTQGQGVDAGRHQPLPLRLHRRQPGRQHVYTTWAARPSRNFTVLPEIALAKVREDAPFDKICYIGCGVTTGWAP